MNHHRVPLLFYRLTEGRGQPKRLRYSSERMKARTISARLTWARMVCFFCTFSLGWLKQLSLARYANVPLRSVIL
jgi:hypothetical protein